MSKRKKCQYAIIVNTRDGLKFVTKLVDHDAYWNDNEKALLMAKSTADDVAFGLCMNCFLAMVVEVPDYIQELGNKSIPAYEPDIEIETE
jgi:hypothetical protein